METAIQIFKNNQFGEVRVITNENNEPYFVGRDIAIALGYSDPVSAISQHVDYEDKAKHPIHDNQGIIQKTTVITESGVYSLVFGSKLESARQFKKWVTSEVLPSIRKSGGYIASKADDSPETIMARAVLLAKETIDKMTNQLKEQAPKVLFANAVETSNRSVLVAELAKIIKQNGYEIGQNRLFEWLRKNGYLCSKGDYYNQPTQKAIELGLFELKKTSISKPDGSVLVTTTTKVTGKGQVYFVNKFLKA